MERIPFPEIKILQPLERIKQLGHFLLDQMHHDLPNRGAAPVLDAALYDEAV